MSVATPLSFLTEWIAVEPEALRAPVAALPDATAVPFPVQVQLVVEFYS